MVESRVHARTRVAPASHPQSRPRKLSGENQAKAGQAKHGERKGRMKTRIGRDVTGSERRCGEEWSLELFSIVDGDEDGPCLCGPESWVPEQPP